MNTNRSDSKTVCLSDVADEVSDRIDNPSKSGFNRFVGLEHFDSGELRVRRWGRTDDLVSAMKLFQAGDILVARRNVYLKRASMVDFYGVCSGDAIVLREKENIVERGYVAFVLNTEEFWEYAIANANGSMSKRINVKNLLKYTFKLPPLEEQKRITGLLWAADKSLQAHRDVLKNEYELLTVALSDTFRELEESNPLVTFSSVGEWKSGGTPSRKVEEYWNGDIPWVSPKDMKTDEINDSIEKITGKAVKDGVAGAKLLPTEVILFVVRGMILAHTFPIAITKCPVAINQDMKAVLVGANFHVRYVFYWLKHKSTYILSMTEESSHGTKRLATETLSELLIPRISIEAQQAIVARIDAITKAIQDTERHIAQTQMLLADLCNKFVGGATDV